MMTSDPQQLEEEVLFLTQYGNNYDRESVLRMPIETRMWHLNQLLERLKKEREEYNKILAENASKQ